jgi:MFS family permease
MMQTKSLLRLYLLMSLLEEPLFWGPILLLAMAKLGHMSVEQLFLSEALAMGLILLLDAPHGVLADVVGRKICVIMGKFCFLISTCMLAFMETPLHGYLANVLWAIGISLRSGAESALIYDELALRDALHEYPPLMKRCHSYWFFMTALTTLATGFIAEINLRLPLLLSLPGVFISTILIFFFPKEVKTAERVHTWRNYKNHVKDAWKEVRRNKTLQTLIIWLSISGVLGKLYFFTYNPYLELVRVPYSHVGIIFALLNLVAFGMSRYAFLVHETLARVGISFGFLLQSGIMFTQIIFIQPLSGWMLCAQGLTRGYLMTISESLLNKEIETKKRATVLSFHSSCGSILQILGFLIIAPISNNILLVLFVLGVTTLTCSFLSRRL